MAVAKRVRVKICGITRPEDAVAAAKAGADAIGLVFYEPSPRAVTIEQAKLIIKNLPAFVTTTALFVDADPVLIKQVIDEVKIDLLQFHGEETAEFCRQFSRPYIKAVAMQADTDVMQLAEIYKDARALLLDTYKPGVPGGTGEVFNWQWIPKSSMKPIVLAGGLTLENIQRALAIPNVWAMDVSGGVELEKGIKSPQKITDFIQATL
ncbi:phosphoribosylanthranilate isomerase [Thiomicrospira pelophila]|uniref:phosphoribosylanthranilate isomerase n=1 Tax=Thiomicrospira pelophila TaxID=934 RepID=UPI0004A6E07F|nr:phosphoribosylanthranilate isomerase [Thiomicrospira pelophila]